MTAIRHGQSLPAQWSCHSFASPQFFDIPNLDKRVVHSLQDEGASAVRRRSMGSAPSSKAPKPAVLIVPGAWHLPDCYSLLAEELSDAGFDVHLARIESVDTKHPLRATCSRDAETVRSEHLIPLIDGLGKDLLVLCHSYGGIVAGGAAHGLSKASRMKQGKLGGVVGLIYLAAFVVPEGVSTREAISSEHAHWIQINQPSLGWSMPASPDKTFFADVETSETKRLESCLRPTALRALISSAPPQAWAEPEYNGKRIYFRCLEDAALPPVAQDQFIKNSGVPWRVVDIAASHSAFASKPAELVKIIETFEGESHEIEAMHEA